MKICICYEMYNTQKETYSNLWSDEFDSVDEAKKLAVLNIKSAETKDKIVDSISIVDVGGKNYKTLFTYCPQNEEWEKHDDAEAA